MSHSSGKSDLNAGVQEVIQCNELTLRGVLYKAESELKEAQKIENDKDYTGELPSQPSKSLPLKTKRSSSRPKRGRKGSNDSSVRRVLAKHAQKIAEAYFNYQRCVNTKTDSLIQQHLRLNHMIDKSLKNRATSFLRQWRLSIQVGDKIACPDYMDEYEQLDEERGWIKLYGADVIDVSTDCNTRVPVGDSSADLDARTMREVKPGEKAIFVHYEGYPKEENRWIVISPSEYVTDTDISYHVFPRDSNKKSIQALSNLYSSSNMELEEALDEAEEQVEEDHDEDDEESSTSGESDNDTENDDCGEDNDDHSNGVNDDPPRMTVTSRQQRNIAHKGISTVAKAGGTDSDNNADEEGGGVKERQSRKAVSQKSKRQTSEERKKPYREDASPTIDEMEETSGEGSPFVPIARRKALKKPQRGRQAKSKPKIEVAKPTRELESSAEDEEEVVERKRSKGSRLNAPAAGRKPKAEIEKSIGVGAPQTFTDNTVTGSSNTRPARRERRLAVPRALQLEQEQAIEELQKSNKKRTTDDLTKVKPEDGLVSGRSQPSKRRKSSTSTVKRDGSTKKEIKIDKHGIGRAKEIKQEAENKSKSDTTLPDDLESNKPALAASANKRTRKKNNSSAKQEKESKKKAKKKEPKSSSNDDELGFTWICTECREAECITHPDSLLLICEGKCNRPFHYPCAGLAAMPPDDETWICNDCTEGKHKCACCHTYGVDNHDVFCCSSKGCGLFFHESCLNMYNVEVELETIEVEYPPDGHEHDSSNPRSSPTIPNIVSRPKFKCPAHMCWTCNEDLPPPPEEIEHDGSPKNARGSKGKKRKKKKALTSSEKAFQSKPEGRLYRCLECPIAYHISCIPPPSRFHELALLCHEHASTCKLPDLELESSFQGQVEADADKRLEKALKASRKMAISKVRTRKSIENLNMFFPGMVGHVKTENEKTMLNKFEMDFTTSLDMRFCLPCDFKNEVHSKPPAYRQVHSLRYNPSNKPKRKPPSGESCKCKKSCDENCLNRMVMMECIGDGNKGKGEKNPYWNCNCGPKCGNRALSQRKFAKCRPQREQGKGWGLITVNGVKKGELVQEYVGAVIDDKTKEERLKSWARDHPNDPNFYIMALDSGWFIDAREEANMSRFINHSCDPNCHLVRLNVEGQMRVGVFSLKDIPAGDFLSYDYQFDTKHGEKFVCRCGAKGCRGTMKGGKASSGEDPDKKSKKQVRLEAKASYERDKKFLEDVEKKAPGRLWQVGVTVPGSTTNDGAELVASGPQDRYRDIALRNRLFLWRNVMRGANFQARYAAFEKRRKRMYSEPSQETINKVDILSIVKQTS